MIKDVKNGIASYENGFAWWWACPSIKTFAKWFLWNSHAWTAYSKNVKNITPTIKRAIVGVSKLECLIASIKKIKAVRKSVIKLR